MTQVGSLAGRACSGLPGCHPSLSLVHFSYQACKQGWEKSVEGGLRVFLVIDAGKLERDRMMEVEGWEG